MSLNFPLAHAKCFLYTIRKPSRQTEQSFIDRPESNREKKTENERRKKGSIRFILGKPGENYSYRCMHLRD